MTTTTPSLALVAGGDIMLGEHPIMVGRGTFTELGRRRGFDPFAGVAAAFGGADLAFGNLECALVDPPAGAATDARTCVGPARGVDLLAQAGFDALSVANNHIEQHGPEPLLATVSAIEDRGIAAVGLAGDQPGRCRPRDLERQGVPLRLLGYSQRPRQHFTHVPQYAEGTTEGILADIRDGVGEGRVVVVSIHWGDEFVPSPSAEQVALGRAMIDAGATLVLGHHPHVLQGWERHGNGAIVYSLGNLVFDMPWQEQLRRTGLFHCTLGPGGVDDIAWTPLELDARHSPQTPAAEVAAEITSFLEAAERGLATGEGPLAVLDTEAYETAVRGGRAAYRKASHGYFLRHLWRYEPRVMGTIVSKFVRRRLGLLKD